MSCNCKFGCKEELPEGLKVITPTVYADERGALMETWTFKDFKNIGIDEIFVQDNHSISNRGVLRGLHFQRLAPQGKLVRVVSGRVYDVAVDMRPESSCYGKWFGIMLSAENKTQIYIPPRFAHGFLAIDNNTEVLYKCTEYFEPEHGAGVLWESPEIGIDWQLDKWGLNQSEIILSEKDRKLPLFGSLNRHEIWL